MGKFFLNDKASYTGSFKKSQFVGQGCLVKNNTQWQAGRWLGSDLIVPDSHSGRGKASLWLKDYFNEQHTRSKKYIDKTIKLDRMVEPAFYQIQDHDIMLAKIEAFAPANTGLQYNSTSLFVVVP